MDDLVSIITPSYNSEKYIAETIKSVQAQTYANWEMIITDDCSTDNTCAIIEDFIKKDNRIKLIKSSTNNGAAVSRNISLDNAKGKYITYLDADDIWLCNKLEKQVAFMQKNNYAFTCASYEVIDDDGKRLNKVIYMKPDLDYNGLLVNNLLQTVGIMADVSMIDKSLLHMPNLRRGQDLATWLQVLKSGFICYGLSDVLCRYRRSKHSLSANKLKAIKRTWHIYRKVEKLSLPFSIYCFVRYAILAVKKRIYRK